MLTSKGKRASLDTVTDNDDEDFEPTPKKLKVNKSSKTTSKSKNHSKEEEPTKEKKKKKQKEKEAPVVIEVKVDPEQMRLARKTAIRIGGHVSISGGLADSINQSLKIGGRSMALFLGNQRTWTQKLLDDKSVKEFKQACKQNDFPPHLILPHGSYLINLGSPIPEKLQKSRELYFSELKRAEQLGLVLYNFHPGSHLDEGEEECLKRISESINLGHEQTKSVIAVLENTAGQGTNVGHKFEQIRKIIDGVKDKTRVGVCLDTCHAFAAGYDLRTKESCLSVFDEFDRIVGFKYLKGMHLNDSKKKLSSKLDRHANIGTGEIGLECFRTIVNDKRFENIPLVLETAGPYDKEINLLYSLIDTTTTTSSSSSSKSIDSTSSK